MVNEHFEGRLWFNASKKYMGEKLKNTDKNSGVGIDVRNNSRFFDTTKDYTALRFDDGSVGQARVKKNSWNLTCTHLIQGCIGKWARNNGLWVKKLSQRIVIVRLSVIKDKEEYYISK